eukprot:scaffold7730_cov110-Isochrysis_galbana.AAC.3
MEGSAGTRHGPRASPVAMGVWLARACAGRAARWLATGRQACLSQLSTPTESRSLHASPSLPSSMDLLPFSCSHWTIFLRSESADQPVTPSCCSWSASAWNWQLLSPGTSMIRKPRIARWRVKRERASCGPESMSGRRRAGAPDVPGA